MYLIVKLTSLPRLQHHNDVKALYQMAAYSGISGNAMIKIRVWQSNMQEKKSIMSVRCGLKNLSLSIMVMHHSAQPHDAEQ